MDPRLLVSIVVDNSAATQGERFEAIKASLNEFCKLVKSSSAKNIEIEIIAFDEFTPKVLKSFSDENYSQDSLQAFKMPFLGKALEIAIKNIQDRVNYFKDHEVETYKPWLFLLTDVYSFDDVDQVIPQLRRVLEKKEILYMPFILSQKNIPQNIEELARTKKFMRIKDHSYDAFFDWFFKMAEKRAQTDIDTPVRFDRSGFEDWAVL